MRRILWILPVLAVSQFVVPVHAQDDAAAPVAPATPPATPSPATPRDRTGGPRVPDFDAATAKKYFDTAEEVGNGQVLKFGLFMRRSNKVSSEEAWKMLNEALAGAPEGSRRWFVLQDIRGFAGYRDPAHNDDANQAFDALFLHVDKAAAAEAVPIVEGALSSYVATVGSNGLMRGDNSTTPEILGHAFEAFLKLPDRKNTANLPGFVPLSARGMDWKQAVKHVGGEKEMAQLVEKMLKTPGVNRYRALRAGASIYEPYDAERSLELMKELQPLVPTDEAAQEDFLNDYVRLLATNDAAPEALKLQKQWIEKTGRGRAKLVPLLVRAKDRAGLDALIKEMSAPEASEEEVLAVVQALRFQKDVGANAFTYETDARTLTENYLAGNRTRSSDREMSTRLSLSESYTDAKDFAKARAILDMPGVQPPFKQEDRAKIMTITRLYNTIVSARKKLDQTLQKTATPAMAPAAQ